MHASTLFYHAGLGLCPQHDVLFPYLTVREHLVLFGGMKGIPQEDIPHAVDEIIHTVGLTEKVCRNCWQCSAKYQAVH